MVNTPVKILITSKNPVKVRATKEVFSNFFKNVSYSFFEVKNCKSINIKLISQPIGEDETSEASRMRVKCACKLKPKFDFYVGIEGGIVLKSKETARIIVYVTIGNHAYLETVRGCEIPLPLQWYYELIKDKNLELGDVVTKVSGIENIKQKQGAVGFLTNNVYKRVDILIQSLSMALIPFLNQNLFHLTEKSLIEE